MMKFIRLFLLLITLITPGIFLPVSIFAETERISFSLSEADSEFASFAKEASIGIPEHKLYEILLNGFIVSRKDSFPIQAAAFRIKSNADRFINAIKKIPGIDVKIVSEENFYKVRISKYPDFERSVQVDSNVQASMAKSDSLSASLEKLMALLKKGYLISVKDSFPVQVGAFRIKSNAVRYCSEIKKISGIGVKIIYENNFFNVRISGYPGENKIAEVDGKAFSGMTQVKPRNELAEHSFPFYRNLNDFIKAYKFLPASAEPSFHRPENISDNSPWQKRIRYFGESYLLVKALIISIIFFIGSMITMLVIILFNRNNIIREQTRHHFLSEKYQSLIVNYLFGNPNIDEFRSIASDNYSRQVLIDQMIDVSVNLKGEEARKLTGLYRYLGLYRDSLDRANDKRWHKKIKGFRELAFMNIRDANDLMYKALDSSNDILRMEAQIALVRLGDKDPFEFLSRLNKPFSLWEQITLHDLIIQHNIPEPSFKRWLASSNFTVVLFALRMIREFRQTDAEDDIRKALLHHQPEVRLLAVEVAGDLGLSSTLETMRQMYKDQDYKISLEILRSIGKMPSVSMMGFLEQVLDSEEDVQLQIEATKSIEKMGEQGINTLLDIMKSEYKNYNIIVKHVLDKRIN